jgi:hypothetical protein
MLNRSVVQFNPGLNLVFPFDEYCGRHGRQERLILNQRRLRVYNGRLRVRQRVNPMLRGMVKFRAAIVDVDKGVTFPLFEFNPNEPGIERVEIEGPKDTEILSRVHVSAVATAEEGIGIATKVHVDALNRISFNHGIAIDNGCVTESGFSPIDPPPPREFSHHSQDRALLDRWQRYEICPWSHC